ncbi:MAG: hypothetical protein DMD92_21695, partial [Candidatus Rokuibacteriota bacterium]
MIQPARCVVTATSADTVTMAFAASVRARAPSTRPNASWVEHSAGYVSASVAGTSGGAAGRGGAQSGGSRRRSAASSLSGGKPSHSPPGATPSAARSSSICVSVRSAVWLSGSAASGSPKPLIVCAR